MQTSAPGRWRAPRGSFPLRVIHDRVEPAMCPTISAVPRLRPIFAVPQNFAMCQNRKWTYQQVSASIRVWASHSS